MARNMNIGCIVLTLLMALTPVWSASAQSRAAGSDELNEELLDAQSREEFQQYVAKLSREQRRDNAVKRITAMKLAEKDIVKLREDERTGGQEISKLNCINDKLSLVKGHINVSDKAYIAMDEAEREGDTTTVTHHYTLVAVSYKKVSDLAQEARLCVGKQVEVSEDGLSIVTEDPRIVPVEPVLAGGYTQLEDIFSDIYDAIGLTPIR